MTLLVTSLSSLFPAAAPLAEAGDAPATPEERAAAYFAAITDPAERNRFLRAMPKGADLHNHLSGAVYAESYFAYAVEDGLCIDLATYVVQDCGPVWTRAVNIFADPEAYNAVIDAWSMRGWTPADGPGHERFFATFGKFSRVTRVHTADMLAETASKAAAENVLYLELMLTLPGGRAQALGSRLEWDGDFEAAYRRLMELGMADVVAETVRAIDAVEAEVRAKLRCGTAAADPGCDVVVRYVNQATRTAPPQEVFAQFVAGFELQRVDPRVVAQNLVSPEDNPNALAHYDLQMEMLRYLKTKYPGAHVDLHAGELTPALVDPEELCCHIRKAIEVAGAERIGHGVDILWAEGAPELLELMKAKDVAVAINLTSNEMILGISGADHPFPRYLAAGVPTVLSTDDPGVERIDLTHEYQRAAETYGLSYETLKGLSRNSITYSFLPGRSLWRDPAAYVPVAECAGDELGSEAPSPACAAFLAGSEKARMQWKLEGAFRAFESAF